jgi:polo-like kinase 1
MTQEIAIHRGLSHRHVVKLEGFFEDIDNVYVLLELCPRRVCYCFDDITQHLF